jgi:hypothetical protein
MFRQLFLHPSNAFKYAICLSKWGGIAARPVHHPIADSIMFVDVQFCNHGNFLVVALGQDTVELAKHKFINVSLLKADYIPSIL